MQKGGRRRTKLAPDDPRHGTTNAYGNYNCRCERCRQAHRISHAKYMHRVRAEGRILGKHGSKVAYESGCRCDRCREAHNKKSREYKRVPKRQKDKAAS